MFASRRWEANNANNCGHVVYAKKFSDKRNFQGFPVHVRLTSLISKCHGQFLSITIQPTTQHSCAIVYSERERKLSVYQYQHAVSVMVMSLLQRCWKILVCVVELLGRKYGLLYKPGIHGVAEFTCLPQSHGLAAIAIPYRAT